MFQIFESMKNLMPKSSKYPHLAYDVETIADQSAADRIQHIKKKKIWINFTEAKAIYSRMIELLETKEKDQPGHIAILGDSGSGKSFTFDKFVTAMLEKHADSENSYIPVLRVQHPVEPKEGRLYDSILKAARHPSRTNLNAAKKQNMVMKVIAELGTKMILIDDSHDAMEGTERQQKIFLTVLRNLAISTDTILVYAALPKFEALLANDLQMKRRVEIHRLPIWGKSKAFANFLAAYERRLPLRKPSDLGSAYIVHELHEMSNGVLDFVVKILKGAACSAIGGGNEKIEVSLLKQTAEKLNLEEILRSE